MTIMGDHMYVPNWQLSLIQKTVYWTPFQLWKVLSGLIMQLNILAMTAQSSPCLYQPESIMLW